MTAMTRSVIFLPFCFFSFTRMAFGSCQRCRYSSIKWLQYIQSPFCASIHIHTCTSSKLYFSIYIKLDRGQVRAILCGSYVFGYFLQVRHSVIPFRNGQVLLDNISENYYWVEFLQNLSISCILFT